MNFSSRTFLYALTALSLGLSGCSDPKEQEPQVPSPSIKDYCISGNVEKGPFINGSEISIQELDSLLNPTGRIFKTNIKNHEGYFDLGELSLVSPFANLTASGYYYNEVKGELSTGPIVLNALVDLSDKKSVYLNLLTHLKQGRVTRLIKEKKLSFAEANQKAQYELFSNFSIQQYAEKEASKFSITAGTPEAGALITLSSIFLHNQTDAEFSEMLALITEQFTQNGTLSEELKSNIREASTQLDFDFISSALIDRYKSLDKIIEVKNLRQFVDWDGNGIAGDERPNWDEAPVLKFEQDTIFISHEGGTVNVRLNANLPFTLDKPDGWPDNIEIENTEFWKIGKCDIQKTISTTPNQIVLEVQPASERMMKPQKITVYSTFEMESSTITVIQKGDPTKPHEITQHGLSYIGAITNAMHSAYAYLHTMEGFYTNCWEAPSGEWSNFGEHTLHPSNNQNYIAFNSGVNVLTYLRKLRELTANDRYTHLLCQNLEALLYTEMLSLWGNLPDLTQISDPYKCVPFEDAKSLLSKFEGSLLELIPQLPDRAGYPSQSITDRFITVADVARFNLSRIYLEKGQLYDAEAILRKIIESNHYQINGSRRDALSEQSTEIIFPLTSNNTTQNNVFANLIEKNTYFAVMPYAEVVLLAAECAYKTDNPENARMYLQKVTDARNTSFDTDQPFIRQLQSVWQQELKGSNSYFAFLKRNGLATEVLNIQDYRQLFPIPTSGLNQFPCATQNPGY